MAVYVQLENELRRIKGIESVTTNKSGKTTTITVKYTDPDVADVVFSINDGSDGQNGVNGKSAYQIALDTGFEGTEAEWLASLKGEAGKNGTNGANGKDGINGQTPYIGGNGNWWIGSYDTGVLARGSVGSNDSVDIDWATNEEIDALFE